MSVDRVIIAMGERIIAPAYAKRANVSVSEEGSTLVIVSAEEEDAGEYKCEVAIDGDNRPELVHTVTIVPTIAKLDEPEVINAKPGDDVTLSCTAVGHPTPALSWTREVDSKYSSSNLQLIFSIFRANECRMEKKALPEKNSP